MRSRPNHNNLDASLSQPAGTHGVLPVLATRTSDFLEFAQAAGGFGVFDLDLATGNIGGTPLFFELIGLPCRKHALTREEWVATIHPEDLESVVLTLGAAIDTGAKYQCEHRTLLLTGEVRWLAGRAEIVQDAAGQAARAIGTLYDITERKELEEKLRYATDSLNIAQAAAGLATFDFNFGRNWCQTRCQENIHSAVSNPCLVSIVSISIVTDSTLVQCWRSFLSWVSSCGVAGTPTQARQGHPPCLPSHRRNRRPWTQRSHRARRRVHHRQSSAHLRLLPRLRTKTRQMPSHRGTTLLTRALPRRTLLRRTWPWWQLPPPLWLRRKVAQKNWRWQRNI